MSGRKNYLNSYKIINAGDVSLTSITSSATNIQGLDNVGIQVNVVSGTFSGVITVEVSADHQEINGNVTVAGNWVALSLPVSATITSSSPTSIYLDLNQISSLWIRVKYTKTSGTGSLDAFIVAKML